MSTATRRDDGSASGRFAEIGRHLDELVARTDDLKKARGFIARELKVWREWIDELRVQNELAKMEIRDRMVPALDRLELAYEHGSGEIHRLLEDPAIDSDGFRRAVKKELEGLRRDIEAARTFEIS